MLTNSELETILQIHGVDATFSHDTIRQILLSAQCSEDEICNGLLVFSSKFASNVASKDGLYKIFRTDQTLRPAEISALLGIDVKIQEIDRTVKKVRAATHRQSIVIWILTILLAMFGLIFAMYFSQIGPFHQAAGFSFFKQ